LNYYVFKCQIDHNQSVMVHTLRIQSLWARIITGLFFSLSGIYVTLVLSLGAPSFWYVVCAILWTLSGVVWFFRPPIAAALAVFPVLVVAVLCGRIVPDIRAEGWSVRLMLLCAVVALALIVISLRWNDFEQRVCLAISLFLVLIAFGVDRLWTNRIAVHEYSMNWSANGVAPWGSVETDPQGGPAVVVYRKVVGGFCYDTVFSPELRERLVQSNKPTVVVQYNVFSDFGRERMYNIRAIDGVVLDDLHGTVRAVDWNGGYFTTGDSHPADCER
jgi:hypothetical protein